ncbi:hypothetical protein HpCK38_16420 [Helicobacter pylori]
MHYKPIHLYKLYHTHEVFYNAENFYKAQISIPCHQKMSLKDAKECAEKVNEIFKSIS